MKTKSEYSSLSAIFIIASDHGKQLENKIIKLFLIFLLVPALGRASMNSIGLTLKCCPLSHNKSQPYKRLNRPEWIGECDFHYVFIEQ